MGIRTWAVAAGTALVIAIAVLASGVLAAGIDADRAEAQANPSLEDTARLLGYMWGDGSQNDAGVWDVNGPSGTSSLIEELIDRHGGTFVDRSRLRFTLPSPYDWDEWTTGLPDDSSTVRSAVQDPHFLAAVLETEASVTGQIYDQSACCVNGYTIGRLTELRDLLRSAGYSTASLDRFNDPNSGRVLVAASQWDDMRRDLEFACPASNSAIRIPGGTDLATYGDLQWLSAGSAWAEVIRTDCTIGRAVPDVGPQQGSCSVTQVGDDLRIDWTYTLGSVVIRVDGSYIETVSGRDGSWTGSVGGGDHSAEVRVFAFGERADADCGSTNGGGGGNGQCVAVAAGSSVSLSWDNFGASSYAIRRNGDWVRTVEARSATVSGSTNDSWIVRYRQNGEVIDVSCSGDGGAGDSPCTITSRDSGVRVDWDGVAGVDDYQVRRNGSWIGEATGMSRYDDTGGGLNANYEIRYSLAGDRFSITC